MNYYVFNETDGIYACPDPMPQAEAEAFMASFRERFIAQGYYKAFAGRIPLAELRLTLIPEEAE